MAEFATGVVLRVSEKQIRSGTVYNAQIEVDGWDDAEWFGLGFDKPKFGKNGEIEFEFEENDKGYLNVVKGSIQVLDAGEYEESSRGRGSRGGSRGDSRGGSRGGGRPAGRSGGGAGGAPSRGGSSRGGATGGGAKKAAGGMSKDDYWERKAADDKLRDQRILWQSCQNTAVATVNALLAQELVALPAKKADKYDAVIALIDEEAERLHALYAERMSPKSKLDAHKDEPNFDEDVPDFDDEDNIPD